MELERLRWQRDASLIGWPKSLTIEEKIRDLETMALPVFGNTRIEVSERAGRHSSCRYYVRLWPNPLTEDCTTIHVSGAETKHAALDEMGIWIADKRWP